MNMEYWGGVYMRPSELFIDATNKSGFYNIMPIDNISSVLKHGILSYQLAINRPHMSVAMSEVQSIRDTVSVPNGMDLHKYANVYFDARNPMLYKRKNESVCVLKISPLILDLPDVVVADRNASSSYVRFYEPYYAFDSLNYDLIYAEYWNDPDPYEYLKRKSIKCAEVLVPYKIDPQFIIAAAVKDHSDEIRLLDSGFDRKIFTDKHLFFK